jgi:hypothetical protein
MPKSEATYSFVNEGKDFITLHSPAMGVKPWPAKGTYLRGDPAEPVEVDGVITLTESEVADSAFGRDMMFFLKNAAYKCREV